MKRKGSAQINESSSKRQKQSGSFAEVFANVGPDHGASEFEPGSPPPNQPHYSAHAPRPFPPPQRFELKSGRTIVDTNRPLPPPPSRTSLAGSSSRSTSSLQETQTSKQHQADMKWLFSSNSDRTQKSKCACGTEIVDQPKNKLKHALERWALAFALFCLWVC